MQSDPAARQLQASCRSRCARVAREQGFSVIDILMVVALIGIIAAIAVPVTGSAVSGQKFNNDSQALTNLVGLAKMRASAAYTRARVRANLANRTFALERWDKTTNAWVTEGAVTPLSLGVTFGFGTVADRSAEYPDQHRVLGGLPRRPHGRHGDDRQHRLRRLQLARPARRWGGPAVRGSCPLSDRRSGCVGHDSDLDAAHPAVVDAGASRNGRVERTTVTATTLDLNRPANGQRGFSLVETMVALCLLLIVTAGVLPLAVMTFRISENHGHLLARATEYAQDKLEQLMSLSYGDVVTDTRVFPAVTSGGTGLTPGGSADTTAPVDGYVDYLTLEGGLLATVVGGGAPADWYYQRVWQVEELGAADPARCPVQASAAQKCLKRITVTTTVRTAAQGGGGITPRSTVTALKSYPF